MSPFALQKPRIFRGAKGDNALAPQRAAGISRMGGRIAQIAPCGGLCETGWNRTIGDFRLGIRRIHGIGRIGQLTSSDSSFCGRLSAARHGRPCRAVPQFVSFARLFCVKNLVKLSRFDRLALIFTGSLLLVSPAGCASSRSQPTVGNRPQDSSYGSNPYGSTGPQVNPGYRLDPGYSQDEYPDFRGKRGTGNGNSDTPRGQYPAAQDGTEFAEPPGTDGANRRSFRESLHQKMTGMWKRPSSGNTPNNTASRPPVAAGAAASGWDVNFDDNLLARNESENTLPEDDAVSESGLINLDAPVEKRNVPQKAAAQRPGMRRAQADDRQLAASSKTGPGSPLAIARPGSDEQPAALRPVRSTFEQPPEWEANRQSGPAAVPVSQPRILSSGPAEQPGNLAQGQLQSGRLTPGAEPVRMADPPRLNIPPSEGEWGNGIETSQRLTVSRMLLCRQVRGFDDVVEIHPQSLRRGQPILVYASLDSFLSIATTKGYRTLTLSTLEIQNSEGDVVLRMPLGTAVDLSEVPRQDFFLTHRVTVPENLPPGDYILDLRIDDLQAHESSRSQIAVAITEDRTHPGGTGDISKFATRPDSLQR